MSRVDTYLVLTRVTDGMSLELGSKTSSPCFCHRNQATEAYRIAEDRQKVCTVNYHRSDCTLDPIRSDDYVSLVRSAIGEMEDIPGRAGHGWHDGDTTFVEMRDVSG